MKSVDLPRQPNLRLNVVANYAGKFWGIASVYIFVPVYISLLGMNAYGLISFNAIVLALLFIADAGLSSSFAREAAKGQRGQELLDSLTSIERVLFLILTLIGATFAALAPVIADHWLDSVGALDRSVVVQSLQLMPFALVPQIAMSLYVGGLMGLERQVVANLLTTTFNLIRSGLVIIPIYFIHDVRLFFAWQAISSVLMLLVMRATLRRYICSGDRQASSMAPDLRGRFSVAALQNIRGYALGMLGMSFVAGLNTQLDKIVVSKMLPLAEFAQYSLASTLALIPYVLTLPVATALLPRFTNLLETNRRSDLERLYRSSTYYIASIGTISGVAICLFVGDVMKLWLQGQHVNDMVIQAARLLALGSTFLTFQLAPYQLSLAHGHTATNLRLGLCVLLVSIPLQIFLTSHYGMLGASSPWLLLNAVAFIYLGATLHIKFPIVKLSQFFVSDTLPAAIIGIIVLVTARQLTDIFNVSAVTSCFCAVLAAIIAFALTHVLRRRVVSVSYTPA